MLSHMRRKCPHGADAPKYKDGSCKRCAIERAKIWALANPEKRQIIAKRHYLENRAGYIARARATYLKDPEKAMARTRKNLGMPLAERPRPSTCECCGKHQTQQKRRLALDHCHSTGKFRGWLCSACNAGLGLFKDSPHLLVKAIEYLKRTG
jgi:hypothetical protein